VRPPLTFNARLDHFVEFRKRNEVMERGHATG